PDTAPRAAAGDLPSRMAAHQVEADPGEAGRELVDAADVADLDRRLLTRQSHQRDLADRRHRSEALALAHPIVEAADRQDCGQAALLIVTRNRLLLPAALKRSDDGAGGAQQQRALILARSGGQRIGMAVGEPACAIAPHRE